MHTEYAAQGLHFLKRMKSKRIVVLSLVLIAEVILLGSLFHAYHQAPRYAFLFKDGSRFKIAHSNEGKIFSVTEYMSLSEALENAQELYFLTLGTNPNLPLELEHAWRQNRRSSDVVYWKLLRNRFLFQMTFPNSNDATLFLSAIRQGAYTPSPFGNALLLVPGSADKFR